MYEQANSGRMCLSNLISSSALASDLALVMLEDKATKEFLEAGEYTISLNTKFQLLLKNVTPTEEVAE